MQGDKNVNKKGFFKGMMSELKKVIWPTGKQTVKSTFVTITFVLLIAVVLIVLNLAFNALNNWWIGSLTHQDIINNIVTTSGETSGEVNQLSGEVSGDIAISGETISGEIPSGE